MKEQKFSAIAFSALLGLMLAGCGSDDGEVIPEISTAKKAEAAGSALAKGQDSLPELQSIQSLSADTGKANGTFSTKSSDLTMPGKSGSITIQVSIQPSKRIAEASLKKLADNGIQGYIAQVENPGELEGTYYRVRVGYFKKLEDANLFGKKALEPLGFAWWIDNKANDSVGSPESENTSSYQSTDSYNNAGSYTAQAQVETPEEAESSSSAEESSSAEAVTETSTAAIEEIPSSETASSSLEQPAAAAPVQQPAEVYDDWE